MTDLACAIDLLEDRASLYRLLASLYYQPLSEEQIDALAASDLAGLAGDSESPFAPAYRDLHGALRLRHTGTKEELAADFTGAFYGIRTREGRTAQPFESLFRTQGPGQLMGEARSEVYRELRAHQLRVPEGVDLPEDTTCRSSSPTWAVFATMPPRPCARETKARPQSSSSASDPSSGPMWPRGYGIFWPRRG